MTQIETTPLASSAVGAVAVDVVILTWNDGELLAKAIDSVHNSVTDQPGSRPLKLHVIVVDNGSEPAAVVPDWVELIRLESNFGVAGGRNVGTKASTSELVCFLDSDAELAPDSLHNLVDEMFQTGAGLVVPCFTEQTHLASAGLAPNITDKVKRVLGKTTEYREATKPSGHSWPVDFGIGACQLFKREAYDAVGGLDEEFFYTDDVDFCLRVGAAGYPVRQVAGAEVHHPPRRIHRKPVNRKGLEHTLAVFRYWRRHFTILGNRRK